MLKLDIINELGTDIRSDWSFKDGDLELVSNNENLIQATANRLNTRKNSLSYFYIDYGSMFHHFNGWRRNDTTLRFMQLELEKALKQDPRFVDFSTSLEFNEKGGVDIGITAHFDDSTVIEMNYVIGETGDIEEY